MKLPMNASSPRTVPSSSADSRNHIERVFDLAYGTDEEIQKMGAEELAVDLNDGGVNHERGWEEMKTMLAAHGCSVT